MVLNRVGDFEEYRVSHIKSMPDWLNEEMPKPPTELSILTYSDVDTFKRINAFSSFSSKNTTRKSSQALSNNDEKQ